MAEFARMSDRGINTAVIAEFNYSNPARLIECASISERVGQLAVSFPLAFFALATRYGPLEARRNAVRRVVEGGTLAEVATELGLPICFRSIPPQACSSPLPYVRWSPEFGRRFGPMIGAMTMNAAWLRALFYGARAGGEEFAIWVARHPVLMRSTRVDPRPLLPLAMAAWHTAHPPGPGSRMPKARWSPDQGVAASIAVTAEWLRDLKLEADLGPAGVTDIPWLEDENFDGFEIRGLRTPVELVTESITMRNCVDGYGGPLSRNECRLFSMREDGKRVATFDVRRSSRNGRLWIGEMRAVANVECQARHREVADRWLCHRSLLPGSDRICVPDPEGKLGLMVTPYVRAVAGPTPVWLGRISFADLKAKLQEVARRAGAMRPQLRWL